MRLDLHEIIGIPGSSASFKYEIDLSDMHFDLVKAFKNPVTAEGEVRNIAGVLVLSATVTADMVCICARCLTEFEKHIDLAVEATLSEEVQDEDNPDIYLLDGDFIDVDEVIITAFVLNMEQRFFCREDCRGLCDKCGNNLNDGPCHCKAETDPRLAVLGQLLENE